MRPLPGASVGATVAPMANNLPTAPQGEQPAVAPIEVTAEASAQPFTGDIAHAIESMDQESLLAMLDGNPLPASFVLPVDPQQPAPNEGAQGEPQAGEQPAETIQPEPSEDSTPKALNRISVRGIPADQAAQMAAAAQAVKTGLVPDIASYFRQISGETAAAAEPTAVAEPTPQPEAPAPQMAELDAEIARLSAELDDGAENYNLTPTQQNELNRKIMDLKVEKRFSVIEAKNQQAQVATYQQAHEKAVDAVETKYGALLDDAGSPFGKFLSMAVTSAHATNDPALKDPAFIVAFADQIATDLGLNGTHAASVAAPAKPPTGPPARASRPVGSTLAPGHSQAPRYTPDQVHQLVGEATFEDLMAVIDNQ